MNLAFDVGARALGASAPPAGFGLAGAAAPDAPAPAGSFALLLGAVPEPPPRLAPAPTLLSASLAAVPGLPALPTVDGAALRLTEAGVAAPDGEADPTLDAANGLPFTMVHAVPVYPLPALALGAPAAPPPVALQASAPAPARAAEAALDALLERAPDAAALREAFELLAVQVEVLAAEPAGRTPPATTLLPAPLAAEVERAGLTALQRPAPSERPVAPNGRAGAPARSPGRAAARDATASATPTAPPNGAPPPGEADVGPRPPYVPAAAAPVAEVNALAGRDAANRGFEDDDTGTPAVGDAVTAPAAEPVGFGWEPSTPEPLATHITGRPGLAVDAHELRADRAEGLAAAQDARATLGERVTLRMADQLGQWEVDVVRRDDLLDLVLRGDADLQRIVTEATPELRERLSQDGFTLHRLDFVAPNDPRGESARAIEATTGKEAAGFGDSRQGRPDDSRREEAPPWPFERARAGSRPAAAARNTNVVSEGRLDRAV